MWKPMHDMAARFETLHVGDTALHASGEQVLDLKKKGG